MQCAAGTAAGGNGQGAERAAIGAPGRDGYTHQGTRSSRAQNAGDVPRLLQQLQRQVRGHAGLRRDYLRAARQRSQISAGMLLALASCLLLLSTPASVTVFHCSAHCSSSQTCCNLYVLLDSCMSAQLQTMCFTIRKRLLAGGCWD